MIIAKSTGKLEGEEITAKIRLIKKGNKGGNGF
jgi:hypothetical protein